MKLIDHPDSFKHGIRVLLLVGRHKDGIAKQRKITRISKGLEDFDKQFNSLLKIKEENERIYASACERDMLSAIRKFRFQQLEAEYSNDYFNFYFNIEARMVSALMDPTSTYKSGKLWMFDCDSKEEYEEVFARIRELDISIQYSYNTKNGIHLFVKPFNKMDFSPLMNEKFSDNPMMLWAY
jgi:hypothetical protein